MTFETETYFTLEEYKKLSRKLVFKKRPIWLLLAAATISAAMLLLNWTGIISPLEPSYQAMFWVFAILGLSVIFLAFGNGPEKHYNSNKMVSQKKLYIFDGEKLSYKLLGAEGSLVWDYINRYEQVDNFLLLYTSDRHAHIIKADGLNVAQIAFIKSKIRQPANYPQVKPVR